MLGRHLTQVLLLEQLIKGYWCPLRHCAHDLPHFLTPSPLFCMRKDALFWLNVCNASRHTIFDAPHYLRKQRQEDCGIAKSLTHTAIRQLTPSARQSSKTNGVNSLSEDDKAQSVGEQTVPGVSCDLSLLPRWGPKLISKLLQLWNKFPETETKTSSFILGQNREAEALCPLEHHRNGFGRDEWISTKVIIIRLYSCWGIWVLCPWERWGCWDTQGTVCWVFRFLS